MARILVVDDDEAARYATAKLLRATGHEVVDAFNYRDALPILERSKVDLLIVDVVLPEVHGFALARMARMKRHDLPCIYVTGFDLPSGEAVGPVLRKPVNDEQLLAEIAKLLPAATGGSTMRGYRLELVDAKGARTREAFFAADDDMAAVIASAVCDACADSCHSYELWQGGRQVVAFDGARSALPAAPTDGHAAAIEQIALNVEESLQRTRGLIARSQRLLAATQQLKEKLNAGRIGE